MITWFKKIKRLAEDNKALIAEVHRLSVELNIMRNRVASLQAYDEYRLQEVARITTSQISHADLLADRVKTHIALGCPESYARMKQELSNYERLYRGKI